MVSIHITMTSHMYGFDHASHNWEAISLDGSGKLEVAANINTTGLATDTLQTAGNASLASLDGKVTACDTGNISGAVTVGGTVTVDGSAVTQPVSAVALPLPAGAATESSLAALNTKVTACDTSNIAGAVTVGGTVTVDGSAVTQPVSGTFFPATQPVSAVSLPLPSTAATDALQTAGNASLATIAGCENGGQALQVDIQADAVGIASQANQAIANASLSTLENCVDQVTNEVQVVLSSDKLGLATGSDIAELNDNAFVSETVVVASASMDNTTTSINCTNYSKVEVILKGSIAMNATQFMLQWSPNGTDWYSPQFYQTLYEQYDADGTTSVGEQGTLMSDVLSKYVRVRLYNPGLASDTITCLIARVH